MLDPGQLAIFIPIIALMIPVVALLTKHQQRMTELVHGNVVNGMEGNSERLLQEIQSLRLEVTELKQILYQQAISLDSMRNAPIPAKLEDRLDPLRP